MEGWEGRCAGGVRRKGLNGDDRKIYYREINEKDKASIRRKVKDRET